MAAFHLDSVFLALPVKIVIKITLLHAVADTHARTHARTHACDTQRSGRQKEGNWPVWSTQKVL